MPTRSFTEIYHRAIQQQQLNEDPAQLQAVDALQRLYQELVADVQQRPGLLARLKHRLLGAPPAPKGIYLWGGVGRGKTFLMNLFVEALPFEHKTRMHFHHFMLDVHSKLTALQHDNAKNRPGKNPLQHLARDYASRYRVICLDEFIVTNITDAMLLYGLLDALFRQRVALVATSNRVPDDLYLNGLQRERFLPAIELIKQHTEVVHLNSPVDHRVALLQQSHVYHTPIDAHTHERMQQQFRALATSQIVFGHSIRIQRRDIPTVALSDRLVWFEFDVLCNTPRATPDYIEITEQFRTVMLSNVPIMTEDMDDRARRFIYLIDELYDKRVTLIISAEAEIDQLYQGKMLDFAFRRTRSRLLEMRSQQYLVESGHIETS